MVLCGGVFGDGVEIVLGQKRVYLVIVVVCVYDYSCFAFVGSGYHGIIVGDLMQDLFQNVRLSLVCGVLMVSIVQLLKFFGGYYAEWVL